ncbi:MAG TPA: DEAD/DEAH box helicase [Candidatus Thermoplasmatota archaeon]|nr:DEAD/DEAH box helicase [Candidatus Thermoplasmatota archaeon]
MDASGAGPAPTGAPTHVSHPAIAEGAVLRRDYQVSVAVECLKRNTMVILPTGMGKTVIALLVMAHREAVAPGKILFLAPTKPLVEQHAAFLRDTFLKGPISVFTGETPPEDREHDWRTARVICSTPQVIQNDLVAGRIDLKDVTLILFDEAHRATGNYAYVFIADQYKRTRLNGLVVGMTASPGSKPEKVREICENLGIEGVEVRTEADEDTRDYVQDVNVQWIHVAMPDNLKRIAETLRAIYEEKIGNLQGLGVLSRRPTKVELLKLAGVLQAKIREAGQQPDSRWFSALSAQAAALKVAHALELVETQGLGAFETYLERLQNDESKAAKALLQDPRMLHVRMLADKSRAEHPKLRRVAVIISQQLREKADSRIIVFTNYRDTAELLTRELAKVENVRPARFVGQASRSESDKGLSQKEQVAMVADFRAGTHNVLIATSVAEEGLDIPSTDLVIFYEPVPSEIRSIQRRGRTGRKQAGKVVILVTKDTKDETSLHVSRNREKKMKTEVQALKQYFRAVNASEESEEWRAWFKPGGADSTVTLRPAAAPAPAPPQEPAREEEEDRRGALTILADHREFASPVVRELARKGIIVKPHQLPVGDYVVSDRLIVERKAATDYTASLMDGRLFPQVKALREACSAPLMLIEGDGLFATRMSPEAIWGSIASLLTDFRVPILTTRSPEETADLLAALAKREQRDERRAPAVRGEKAALGDEERQRYIVEGLPGVSSVLARRLLDHFGTVRALANAEPDQLAEVEGIGKEKAAEIHRLLTLRYRRPGLRRKTAEAPSAPEEEASP